MATESYKLLAGLAVATGVVSGIFTVPILTFLGLLWLLRLPLPQCVSGAATAPRWVVRLIGPLYQFLVKNVEDTKKAEMAADYSACDADKLLWHFSFGANMDPEILSGRRKVTPKQSKTCCVKGYQLLFSHRGLPYWEPSFATISGEPEQCKPAVNGNGAANGEAKPMTNSASKLNGSTKGHMTDSHSPPGTDSYAADGVVSTVRRGLLAVGSFALGGSHEQGPLAPRQYVTPNEGRAAVHGVVHQITAADMAQIRATEGGGGHDNMGYSLENVTCTLEDGSEVSACAFITHVSSTLDQSHSYAHPSQRYLNIMQRGARHAGLDSSYVQWLDELRPYCWVTAGQYLAAWVVCFSMMASAYLLAAFLVVHQWVLRRKLDSFYMHRYFQVVSGAVWAVHNAALQYLLGRGC